MLSRFRFSTPLYKNTGSVARDHLASERTFLAWIRTGLGFVALGIAIERFSQLDLSELIPPRPDHHPRRDPDEARRWKARDKLNSQIMVGTLMGLGAGSILYGTGRYFSNLKHLERGQFKPAYHGTAIMAAAVAGLAGGVFGSTVSRKREEERPDMEAGR